MKTWLPWVSKIQAAFIFYLALLSLTAIANEASETNISSNPSFFDPDGYYYPNKQTNILGKFQLITMNIHTLEYYYNGEINYESPHFVKPELILKIKKLNSQKTTNVSCTNTKIVGDKINTSCYLSGIGKFFIVGVFVDKKGQFWNREDIIPQQTIVLNADIIMDKKLAKTTMSFTYEAGH